MEMSGRGKESLPGKEGLRGRENLHDVLEVSSVARSLLDGLLERPEFLRPEHREELVVLVGPEWGRLGADIERYRSWSARATALLQAIDQTPHSALRDSEWMALLREARRAVDEAHSAVRRISFSVSVDTAARSIRDPESQATSRIVGPEGRATRRIVGPEGPATRRIRGPEDPATGGF
jgi:hypothetical protein